jgi:hypothetical protein
LPRKSGKRGIHDASTIAQAIGERQVLKSKLKKGEYPENPLAADPKRTADQGD